MSLSFPFPSRSSALASLTVAFALGCGHAEPPAPVTPTASVAVAPRPIAATAPGSLRRSAVRSMVEAGFGPFLNGFMQKISVDDQPVMVAGRFHGFRIASVASDAFPGVDLRPGDVIVRVDGLPIEHPEEAMAAFNGLVSATELRVDYERDGVARTIRFPIVDDEPVAARSVRERPLESVR